MLRFIVLTALLGLAACAPETGASPTPGQLDTTGDVVVTVDGAKITEDMIDSVTRRIPPEQLQQMKDMGRYDEFVDRIVVGQLLYAEALERKLHDKPEVARTLAMSQREVLASELLEVIGAEAVTDDKIKEAYEGRRVQFARPQVKARHILVKDKALAEELVGQLAEGADFAALAKEHSVDPGSKDNGGDLGWFEAGRMLRPVSEAAFGSKDDAVLGPIESRVGFHVLQVTDRRDETPLEEVRPQLEAMVKQQAVEAYLQKIKDDAAITYADGRETDDGADAGAADAPGHEGHGHGPGAGH